VRADEEILIFLLISQPFDPGINETTVLGYGCFTWSTMPIPLAAEHSKHPVAEHHPWAGTEYSQCTFVGQNIVLMLSRPSLSFVTASYEGVVYFLYRASGLVDTKE
jgi:hypothetical protein